MNLPKKARRYIGKAKRRKRNMWIKYLPECGLYEIHTQVHGVWDAYILDSHPGYGAVRLWRVLVWMERDDDSNANRNS